MTSAEASHVEVERLLRAETGVASRVVHVEQLAHARGAVTRVTFDEAVPGIGFTAIVKRRDPATEVGAFAATNLRTEHAALRFLGSTELDVSPRLIASRDEAGMLLLTDVGRGVEELIFGGDYEAALAALVALATTTARLHRAPHDEHAFADLDTWTLATRESGWQSVIDAVDMLRFPPVTSSVNEEYDRVMAELRAPGPAMALVHGDLGPNNAVLDANGRCRLVDFEGSGYQHIGLDAAMLRFPFAWYGRWAQLPAEVQGAMERAYQEELGRSAAEVDAAVAVGAMAMALLRLERLPRIAATDQSADMAFRRRVQIVSTVDTAVDAARRVDCFSVLATWLENLANAMRQRWDEASREPPIYAAFADASSTDS